MSHSTQPKDSDSDDLPAYLDEAIETTVTRIESENVAPSTAAFEVAGEYKHITTPFNDDNDLLEVLADIREANGICADEVNTYINYTTLDPDYNHGEAMLEAIAIRSLEELLHDRATKRLDSSK
jgi:hypothetical protein